MRGHGKVDRVAGTIADWRDMCPERGGHVCGTLLRAV
jgi:hypothetical protein